MIDGKCTLFRRLPREEKGAVVVLVAFALVAVFGIGALVIDVGNVLLAHSIVQASANASALAGAQQIGSGGAPLSPRPTLPHCLADVRGSIITGRSLRRLVRGIAL